MAILADSVKNWAYESKPEYKPISKRFEVDLLVDVDVELVVTLVLVVLFEWNHSQASGWMGWSQ